ncbi:MAG: ABC transporter ATP-binding protein [Candidatus Omnitrophica bacterium]|nr:ABC transporter ATP-binding protein [Candidatus Omnitrophota bacterium]
MKFVYDCRTKLVSRLLDVYQYMPYHMHLSRNSAHLIANINIHSTTFADAIVLQILRSGVEVFVLFGLFILLALMNIRVMIVMTVYFSTVLFAWDRIYKKRLIEYGRVISLSEAGIISGVNHAVGALKEVRLLGREGYFHSQVVKNADNIAFAGSRSRVLQGVQRYIFETSLVVFIVGTVFMAMITNSENPASVFSFLGVFGVAAIRILPAITQIAFSFSTVRNNLYSIGLLYGDLSGIKGNVKSPGGPAFFSNLPNGQKSFEILECRDLDYRYPGSENLVLRAINIKIRKGESIGIIGKTGSGKTTLIDLILGLLQPTSGGIYLDGVKISQDSNPQLLRKWQSDLIYIPQSIFLVDVTIRRNIAFALPENEIDDERVKKALKESELLEFTERLSDGLNTVVGERGIRLSGGERQRICIARAFYFGREVIVMDEATSALDTETENEILKVINSLHGRRTLIVIAHRLSTIKNCDRLIRLHEGRIVTEGSYADVVGYAGKAGSLR